MDARAVLAQREQELAQLRDDALHVLEESLTQKDRQHQELSAKFEQLKQDFEYNLKLLDERDSELDKYDAEFSVAAASLADKDRQMAELQALVDELQTGACPLRGAGLLGGLGAEQHRVTSVPSVVRRHFVVCVCVCAASLATPASPLLAVIPPPNIPSPSSPPPVTHAVVAADRVPLRALPQRRGRVPVRRQARGAAAAAG